MPTSIITGKMLFLVSIMMISTFTFTGIIYTETEEGRHAELLASFNLSPNEVPTIMDFPTWLQLQYIMAYNKIINGVNPENAPYYHIYTVRAVEWNYQEDDTIFDKYGIGVNSGMAWYNSPWTKGVGWIELLGGVGTRQAWADGGYDSYIGRIQELLEDEDILEQGEKNILELIWEFFASIGNGFISLVKILTFTNIPNAPIWLIPTLNIIFIPMWIVLVVGISPYASKLLEALAKVLDAITPFT